MRDAPSIRSIDVLRDEVREQLATQRSHFEALDAKTGVLLGFAGLLVALAPANATLWMDAARLAGVASAASSLLAFLPRRYPMLDLQGFRDGYLTADPTFTRLALLDTHLSTLETARLLNDHKSRRVRASIAALLIAIILGLVGLIVGTSPGGGIS